MLEIHKKKQKNQTSCLISFSHQIQCICCYGSKVMVLSRQSLVDSYSWSLNTIQCALCHSIKKSKWKEVIVESIFKIWIAIFGSPKCFLVNYGGEFNNSEFLVFVKIWRYKYNDDSCRKPMVQYLAGTS